MTYDAQESSVEDGQPVELYLFTQITGVEYYAYTSGTEAVEYLGKTYQPESIDRTEPKISPKSSSGSMTITMPRTNAFVSRYLGPYPPLPDRLTIYRMHSTDSASEVVTFWDGTIKAVSFGPTTAKVALTTLSERLGGVVPKRVFSWSCNHVLYDTLCQIGAADFKCEVQVSSIDSVHPHIYTITDDPASALPGLTARTTGDDDFFNGGYVDYIDTAGGGGTHSRTIISYDDVEKEMKLNHRIVPLTPGGKFVAYAGCSHSVHTCKEKFNNVVNYGGFPFVPGANPFETGVSDEEEEGC